MRRSRNIFVETEFSGKGSSVAAKYYKVYGLMDIEEISPLRGDVYDDVEIASTKIGQLRCNYSCITSIKLKTRPMTSRREFIGRSVTTAAGLSLLPGMAWSGYSPDKNGMPVVISTWNHGMPANAAAWAILEKGGYALDAVEAGVRVPEADPGVISVGYGGLPDAEGKVTLDAAIMDEKGRAGSVTFLEHIKHPISVARKVMETTPHVMLSGKGALKFALQNGFQKENLLTPEARRVWKKWKKSNTGFKPVINIENEIKENHDTIGMLAIDREGRLCGACTTSGMAFKLHGRVGDSPFIGAGMFVDGEVGGAAATGTGELVMKTLGSFLVVELMRNGLSPDAACREAVARIVRKMPDYREHQIGYIALNAKGETGAFAIQPGFEYAIRTNSVNELRKVNSVL
jgi:isoaspartyl peptidase/L-asparaginase-like protein (Ntn-hydrolase superfamily)